MGGVGGFPFGAMAQEEESISKCRRCPGQRPNLRKTQGLGLYGRMWPYMTSNSLSS